MERSPRTPAHWLVLVGAVLAAAVPWVLGETLRPDPRGFGTHEQLGMRPCGMIAAFGIPCPGCGVTTSVTLAGEGHFLDSMRTQPFGFLLVVLAVLFLPWALFAHARGHDLWVELRKLPVVWTGATAVVVVAACWVYKIVQMS